MKDQNNKIIQALKKTFPKSKIPKKIENLKIGDLKGWDSLGHVNLILEIEKIFKFKFGTKIFLSIQSIKKIKKNLPK
jgi:acyl carrier protein|tara:strand:- start:1975 stop:2205 length:231 start_codon:yes stop_codon:yes gene_type:complete